MEGGEGRERQREREKKKLPVLTLNCVKVISIVWTCSPPEESDVFKVIVTKGKLRLRHSSELTASPSFHLMSSSCRSIMEIKIVSKLE